MWWVPETGFIFTDQELSVTASADLAENLREKSAGIGQYEPPWLPKHAHHPNPNPLAFIGAILDKVALFACKNAKSARLNLLTESTRAPMQVS